MKRRVPGALRSAATRSVTLRLTSLLVLFIFATSASAQELRGRVQGSVTDASGAVIAGANVTLQNDKTAVETVRQTNTAGLYVFDFVLPGAYTLSVEMTGFRKFIQRNILVQTRADVTVDAALELGAVAETISVTAAPVSVKFNTTSMDLTLDTKMTNDLPIVHRNPFLLATLNPAVVVRSTTEQSPYHHWAASQLDVGGGTSTKNDILVDGVPQLMGAKGAYVPPMDAVSEVNVQQNAVDAEFGHSAGGIISVQMKSGTNDWHGSAYYFGRNPALNAVADSTTHRKNLVRNNVWGVTAHNPIRKNKIFNFFAYEAQNVREPRTIKMTLPTERERRGDFSQTRNATGALRQIFDPLTTVFDAQANRSTRTQFPNNIIPAERLDRTAVRMMRDIWQPNSPGDNILTGVNNYSETFPQKFVYWNISDRVDWVVNDNWRAFGRVSRFHTVQSDPLFTGSLAQQMAGSARHTIQVSGDAVWTINPSTVFNIRGSYSKITDSFEAANGFIEKRLFEEFWPGNPWYEPYQAELPALYYPGLTVQAESNSVFGRDGFWFQEPKTWNLQSKISRQMGPHYIKVGGEFRQQLVLASRPRPMGFVFEKAHTADTFIQPNLALRGDGWATFLLGVLNNNSRIQTIPLNKPRNNFWGFYIQDDFKLRHNVTLNLGLRYEYQTALHDPDLRLSRFLDLNSPIPDFQNNAPQLPSQVTALRRSPPVYNGAWIFTDDDHSGSWNPDRNLFLPRAGLAIRVNDRTALRFGYSRYAVASDSSTGIVDVLGSTPYPGFDQITNPLPVLEGRPQAYLSDPYPAGRNPLIPPIGKSRGIYTALGSDTLWFEQDYRNETNDRMNASLQRQVWNQIVLDVTYFANFGHNAPQSPNINLADPRLSFEHRALLNQSVNNPFFQILTPERFPGQLRNQRQVTVGRLLVPYPQFGALTVRGIPLSNTRYHALQISAQRPFANGFNLLFGLNYNRGKSEEFYDNQDEFDRSLTYQSTNNVLPRRKITGAAVYQFPFGRGRRLMTRSHPALDAVLGGWALSGLFEYTSGVFLRFGGLDLIGDPRLDDPSRNARFNNIRQDLPGAAFRQLTPFTRRTNPWIHDGVTGPSFRNLDMTLYKEFPIRERLRFELRMEAYNVMNSFMGANPSTDRTSTVFGQVVNQRAGYFGRQLQYSGRFIW